MHDTPDCQPIMIQKRESLSSSLVWSMPSCCIALYISCYCSIKEESPGHVAAKQLFAMATCCCWLGLAVCVLACPTAHVFQGTCACLLIPKQLSISAANSDNVLPQDNKLARSDLAIHLRPASVTPASGMFQLQYNRTVSMADQQAAPHSEKAYAVSAPDMPIPFADEDAANSLADQELVDASSITAAAEQLQTLIAQVETSKEFADQVKKAEVSWQKAAGSLDRQTQDLVTVFEECVFPNNRYTRKRGDYHGSSLHLPGLVKAVSTDFNYK